MAALEEAAGDGAPVKALTPWIMTLQPQDESCKLPVPPRALVAIIEEESGCMLILMDSATFVHVCPPSFASHVAIEAGGVLTAQAANGAPVPGLGRKEVRFVLYGGLELQVEFIVMQVTKVILSIGLLASRGYSLRIDSQEACMSKDSYQDRLLRNGALFFLPVRFQHEGAGWSALQ